MLDEGFGVLPGVDDGYLEFSTSMRVDEESGLLAAVGIVSWHYSEDWSADDIDGSVYGCSWVDGKELARAEVWGFDGMMSSWGDVDVTLANLCYACDVVSEDLYVAAERLRSAYDSGELAEVERKCFTQRWLILDNVFVVDEVRGFGLGRSVAAHALEMAGAWSDGVAIVSVAGARLDHSDRPAFPSDDDDGRYAEVWDTQRKRSVRLLESLGFVSLPSGIHFGHTSLEGLFIRVPRGSSIYGGSLPWVSEFM